MTPTIYKIEFPSGATYIGATVNLKARTKKHRQQARKHTSVNSKLAAAFVECRTPTFTAIASGFCRDSLHLLERDIIAQDQPTLNVNATPHPINAPVVGTSAAGVCRRYSTKYHVFMDRKRRGWNTLQALGLTQPPPQRKPQVRKATMTLQGVTKTLDAWALSIGIKKATLVARKKFGWTDAQMLGLEPGRQTNRENSARAARAEQDAKRSARQITYKDVTGGISQVCRHFGVPDSQVRSRLKLGWTLEEAFEGRYRNSDIGKTKFSNPHFANTITC